jgi:hypothetical protein
MKTIDPDYEAQMQLKAVATHAHISFNSITK